MTQLQLIEIDPSPGQVNLPTKKTVKAISTSYSALEKHCKEKFNISIGKPEKPSWYNYYLIEPTDVVIVQENITKFK